MLRSQRLIATAVAACLATLVGCGDGRPLLYPVKGVVRFESGDPVRNATIEFLPDTRGPSPRGRIDADGAYVLGTFASNDGAPAGEYRVIVIQALSQDATKHLRDLGDAHTSHARDAKFVSLKHASPDASGIRATVSPVARNDLAITVEAR